MQLEDYLRLQACEQPNKIAVVDNHGTMTYQELWKAVLERAKDLPSGAIVPFRTTQDKEFLITYFAIHLAGSVAVPLEVSLPEEQYKRLSKEFSYSKVPTNVVDILYTTGTTGQSKGVMLAAKTIIANAENLIVSQGYCKETVFVVAGPLNHFGSLSKVYPIIIQGGTLILLEGMKNMDAFFQALEYPSKKLATFLVPSAIRMLLLVGKKQLSAVADKIDFIETGAAPISPSDMKALVKVLPYTRLYNTYASTESGIVSTYDFSKGNPIPNCVGVAMPNTRFRIEDNGCVVCSGETLMEGYLNNPELTKKVLINNKLQTADRGKIDSENRLILLGREDYIINVGGYKVNPIEVEQAALSLEYVEDCICIPYPHPVLGYAPRLLVVMKTGVVFKKHSLARQLSALLETYKVPLSYKEVSSIKRTFNGKLDRKIYTNKEE